MTYSYDKLKEELAIGIEIVFVYRNEKYSISHNREGWYLTKFTDSENYHAFSDWEELLLQSRVDGKSLKEIWSQVTEVY
jgi:hypothetical protein